MNLGELKRSLIMSIEQSTGEVAYLSGPISTFKERSIEENLAAFHVFEKKVKEHATYALIINPANYGNQEADGTSYDDIMTMWLEVLSHPKIKTVLMLPFWDKSRGARAEFDLAQHANKKIVYL